MALTLSLPIRYGSLLLGVVGAAAGLNLSVMGLATAEPATTEIAATAEPTEPDVMQVVVDVPLPPTSEIQADASVEAAAAPADSPAPAAVAPIAPIVPAATPPVTTAPAPPTQPATPATVSPTTQPPATVSPATQPPTTDAPTTAAPTTAAPTTGAPTTEYLSFSFDGVAEIVVARHAGGDLEFWSATPATGWAYQVEKDRPNRVELKFRRVSGGEGEAKFELFYEDGELEVKKER